ncbi:MAG: hypothetical protein VZR36_11580 [Prevotella sp.]|nr:hypothetical protein [Prevotella sp.]
MKRLFIICIFFVSCCMLSWADSPLTSTNFSDAYADEPMVVLAGEHGLGDRIPVELLSFLADKKAPVDVRLAVVNRLTWFSETNDFTLFENYLIKRFKAKDRWKLQKKLDASTLAVYAYAMAVSNRSDLQEASDLVHHAVEKDKEHSFSVAMACALIDAQMHFDNNWSMIYPTVAAVVNDGTLKRDMRQKAIDIIMEYIGLYEKETISLD